MKKSSKSKGVVISLSEILNSFDGDVFVKTKKAKKVKKKNKQQKPPVLTASVMMDQLMHYMKSPIKKVPVDADDNKEEDIVHSPISNDHVDVSDLPYITAEEVAKYPDLLRPDWENYNWSRQMSRKYRPAEFCDALTEKDRALCHWAFHTPLPDGSVGAGASLSTAQPQFHIITGTDGNGGEPVPLSRGSNAPLTWSRQSNDDTGICYPIPQVFDLATAEELVRQQTEYDNKRDAGVDALIMHIIPVCTDPAYVAQID